MKDSLLRVKSFAFALRSIKLQRCRNKCSDLVHRSGTNIEESVHAQSRLDFIHKLSVAQKEACETNYWLRLFRESNVLQVNLADSLIADCEELQRLLAASIKTSKRNLNKEK